ncbi:MAG: hypothetical protein WCL27_15455, partial [Betaproteobacteria bacterium]
TNRVPIFFIVIVINLQRMSNYRDDALTPPLFAKTTALAIFENYNSKNTPSNVLQGNPYLGTVGFLASTVPNTSRRSTPHDIDLNKKFND